MYRHFGVIIAPTRLGEACGETCTLLQAHSAERVRERTLTATVAVRDPVTHGRTCRRGPPGVHNANAVSPDRWERVLRVHAEPLRRKPRAPNGVQLRLPRRAVSQDCERGVQCVAM